MAVPSTICMCWALVHISATGPHFGDSLPIPVGYMLKVKMSYYSWIVPFCFRADWEAHIRRFC
eukprot:733759-Rhodomonas_salina.1